MYIRRLGLYMCGIESKDGYEIERCSSICIMMYE